MRCWKLILLLVLIFSLYSFVLSHEVPKQGHDHYSFKVLQEAVNGGYLMRDDVERLLSKLRFSNCSDGRKTDYRKCLDSSEIYSFAGSSPTNLLNATHFAQVSPLIVYCLLPAPPGQCEFSPKNQSELFNWFARNFNQHGDQGNITHEALDRILEAVNETLGTFLTQKKDY